MNNQKPFKPLSFNRAMRIAIERSMAAPEPVSMSSKVSLYDEAKRVRERATNYRRKP